MLLAAAVHVAGPEGSGAVGRRGFPPSATRGMRGRSDTPSSPGSISRSGPTSQVGRAALPDVSIGLGSDMERIPCVARPHDGGIGGPTSPVEPHGGGRPPGDRIPYCLALR